MSVQWQSTNVRRVPVRSLGKYGLKVDRRGGDCLYLQLQKEKLERWCNGAAM